MAGITLSDDQLAAVSKMKNGCVLCGGVGSGKSRTALAYYYICNGGELGAGEYVPMDNVSIKDLYIITTAKKRDTREWEGEMTPFLLSANREAALYHNKVVVDSWNNIGKYTDVKGAFFLFDEQRVIGSGAWVKSFLKIVRGNEWVLLTATPGDTWQDYIPVFLANGFYKNRGEFNREHVVWNPRCKFPKVERYINTGKLIRLRSSILVPIDFERATTARHEDIYVRYSVEAYRDAGRKRWDPFRDEPIANAGALCYVWRRIVNSDVSRQVALLEIFEKHPRLIVFYNFNYELDILMALDFGEAQVAQWNGHRHQSIPKSDSWVYLVQYTAGCEGWGCIETDTIVFYSQNYSHRVMTQAAGRIDRRDTPFEDLYYFHLRSRSGIDLAISRALKSKKDFNENRFVKW